MVTMMKEKVNSHFSFPLRLDMSGYMESNLISSDRLPSKFCTVCYDLPRKHVGSVFVSCVCVSLSVQAITFEALELETLDMIIHLDHI